jgi:type I restriction enzyme S subunit
MNSLRYEDFKTIYSPVPPGEEVERIVEFLDRTTTEIDRAISQKQRLIELLQEQKAILINQAVTKGLNPNVPMRDSEIDAIGEIPKYWSIKKLGFLSNLLQTGPFGSQLHQEDYIEGGIPALNPSQLIDGEIRPDYKISVSEKMALRLERHRLIEGDIVFGRRGEMGRCGLVSVQEAGWLCGTGSILFRPKTNDISPRFALAVLRSHCMKSTLEYISVGATMDNLNTAILSKVSLPVPPLKEQRQIVMEIEKIKEEFSELISRQLKEIDLLNEMRQVMIASAVTGKIKV